MFYIQLNLLIRIIISKYVFIFRLNFECKIETETKHQSTAILRVHTECSIRVFFHFNFNLDFSWIQYVIYVQIKRVKHKIDGVAHARLTFMNHKDGKTTL